MSEADSVPAQGLGVQVLVPSGWSGVCRCVRTSTDVCEVSAAAAAPAGLHVDSG